MLCIISKTGFSKTEVKKVKFRVFIKNNWKKLEINLSWSSNGCGPKKFRKGQKREKETNTSG